MIDNPNSEEATIQRWEKAIWQSQIAVGLCSTPEPLTLEWKVAMRKAAEAALNAFKGSFETT
jgi:hypothetical protein